MFHNVGNVMVLKSLKDIIDSTKATSLSKHATWGSGNPPAELKVSGTYGVCGNSQALRAIKYAVDTGAVDAIWCVIVKDGVLLPHSIVLSNQKQLIVPAAPGSLQLV